MAASGNRCSSPLRSGLCGRLFVLGEGLEHEFTNALLRIHVGDRAQQRETASFTVDGVRACREGDVASATGTAFPDGEADQLQAVEFAAGEMQLGIGEFADRILLVVWCELDEPLRILRLK